MKSIFLGKESSVSRVYPDYIQNKLASAANLEIGRVYTERDIISSSEAHSNEFFDVYYIFSTWGMPCLPKDVIASLFPNLKAVFYAAGTVQNFARPFLDNNIKVFSAFSANAVPVAEYTYAQILLANKGFYRLSKYYSGGNIDLAKNIKNRVTGNFHNKIGLLGLGTIGSLVAENLNANNFKVMAYDPFCSPQKAEKLNVALVSLEEVFSACDVVSNHLANKPEIEKILNYPLFNSMKQNATFINTGRGAQVDEAGLVQVLKERSDLTVVLDVTYPEPPAPNHPFYELPNVFLTPHIAGSIGREVYRMAEYMSDEFERFVSGKKTHHEVTAAMLDTMA